MKARYLTGLYPKEDLRLRISHIGGKGYAR